MLLALAMVMSLFCAVPVSAEEAEFTLPYVSYDFNDIADGATENYGNDIGTWNAKTYIEGVAGGRALYKESAGTASSDYFSITFNGRSPAAMVTGEPFKISFWLKLNTEVSKFSASSNPKFQLCYTANGGAKGYKGYDLDAQKAALNSGEWVYYEKEIAAWDGKFGTYDTVANPDGATLAIQFRLGYQNGTKPAGNGTDTYPSLMDPQKSMYAVAIDDFRIEPVSGKTPYNPDNVVEEAYVPKTVLNYTFNANDVNSGLGHWNVQNSSTKTVQETGGADGGKYAKITNTSLVGGSWRSLNWTHNQELDDNKLTKVTFWAKAEDASTVGAKFRFTMYRKMNNLDAPTKLDTINVNRNDLFPNDYWYIELPNALTQSWQEYTFYFKNSAKTFDESHYRIALDIKNANTGFKFGIDNMTITQEEIPTNGEFENLAYAPAQTVKSDGTVLPNEQSKKYAANLYGWLTEGATVTADTTVKHGGSQAAKVVTTAANGSPYQGIYLANNKTHEISFWAKGEGNSVGKNISVILDRAVATKSQYDVYPIEDVVTLTPTDATLTNDWKKFTVTYTLNSIAPSTMPTINPNQGIGVRQPFIKFSVDSGAAGMTYYLDDLKIKEPTAGHPDPYITDYNLYETDETAVATLVEGKTVCLKYTPVLEAAGDEIEAVVARVLIESKAGSNKYGTYKTIIDTTGEGRAEIQIPDKMAGRKIVLSIQPFSANGVDGAIYEKVIGTIAKQYDASMTVGSYVPASSSITTTYTVVNNKVDNSDVRAIMAIIFYAENGAMVKCESTPVVVTNGTSVTDATFTATSTLSDMSLPAATKAKVFFWFTEGTDAPSVFNTTMEEVVSSVEVSLN